MERDLAEFQKWADWHKGIELKEFEIAKQKAIEEALAVEDEGSKQGMLRKARKMTFQFDKSKLLNYGRCTKFNKKVCFIPNICQIETQKCFVHRRDI